MTAVSSHASWTDVILDRSILFSFDRGGYFRHCRRFDPRDLEVDLSGRLCLVTGANAGLGKATAYALAERRADVWMLCRDAVRGTAAVKEVRRVSGSDRVKLAELDLTDPVSIDRFVERARRWKVDVLINNAGVLMDERLETADGLEVTLATNLIGPYRLTEGLIPALERSSDPRVINVSSGGMYPVRLQLRDLNWERRRFDGVRAYAESKRALVTLTELWADRRRSTGIRFHGMHPGWADTEGVRRSLPRFWQRMRGRLRTADQGADTIVWLAVCDEAARSSGRFWFDRRPAPAHLLPWTRASESDRQRLWTLCRGLASRHGVRKEAA